MSAENLGDLEDTKSNCTEIKMKRIRTESEETIAERSRNSDSKEYRNICKAMMLSITYSANIGGTSALSGTIPNVICQGQADLIYQRYGMESSGINFMSWMIFAVPGSAISIVLTWIWLQIWFLGWRQLFSFKCVDNRRVTKVLRDAYNKLGPMSFAEKTIVVHFLILLILWLSRKPPTGDGWGSLFKSGYVTDATPALLIMISLFIFPSVRPAVLCFRKSADSRPHEPVKPILDWRVVQHKMPWGIYLLIGGGFALADACEKSGLSAWIGVNLVSLRNLDSKIVVLVLTIILSAWTEFTGNIATISLFLPIIGDLAIRLRIHPLYLMIPCGIVTSFAFMLPVGTPPNAIVLASGYINVKDMVCAGFVVNIICILIQNVAVNTWGMAYFHLDRIPNQFLNITEN